jgi:hypothetical protein
MRVMSSGSSLRFSKNPAIGELELPLCARQRTLPAMQEELDLLT